MGQRNDTCTVPCTETRRLRENGGVRLNLQIEVKDRIQSILL